MLWASDQLSFWTSFGRDGSIVCAVNGIIDQIIYGETGILVEKENKQNMAKTMVNLSKDKTDIMKFGHNARVRVVQLFNDIFVSESCLVMYKKSVGG